MQRLVGGGVYRSQWDGVFIVNICYVFNGDRLVFVKAYHLKENAGKPPIRARCAED
ncbi:hypothetical protein [Methylomonas sp. MgM2]